MPNWQLFNRIRAFARKANLYRTDNLSQDQDQIERVISGGSFLQFSKQSGLLEQTALQINRLERYKDYDMMDEVGEITLALDMYADESSLADPERKHSVVVKAKSKRVKNDIEDFLYNTLLIDREIRPIIRYLCKYGDFAAEIIPTKNRDGVSSFRFINVYNFTRIQTKFGDLVGFYYQDPNTLQPTFLHPWQVMHLRLMSYETIFHPYGRSILDGSRKDFKRLRLMEDAALIYRITRAPEKRIFTIPIGNIPTHQVPQYMELIARNMKKRKFVDPATGQVNERYSPLIQEDDFFLPQRADGNGPKIDTLKGAENLDAIADIEYFKKKMVAGLKIPFNRVGIGDQQAGDSRSLASVSPEFAKAIQWVQRETIIGLKKMVFVHLALKGYDVEDLKSFDLSMTAASAIDELYRIETWNTRADIIANLKDTGLFPDMWILEHFTDMTVDEIRQMRSSSENQKTEEQTDEANKLLAGLSAESIDDDQRKLITELLNVEKSIQEPLERNIRESPALEWYINTNELDNLPKSKSNNNEPIIKSSINESLIKEVKEQTEIMIRGGVGIEQSTSGNDSGDNSGDSAIIEIAKTISPDKNLISEENVSVKRE